MISKQDLMKAVTIETDGDSRQLIRSYLDLELVVVEVISPIHEMKKFITLPLNAQFEFSLNSMLQIKLNILNKKEILLTTFCYFANYSS